MHDSHYIKKFTLAFAWKYIFIFHIITEEHVRSDLAFASQKLKFAGQMSDDRQQFAGLQGYLWTWCKIFTETDLNYFCLFK